MNRKINMFFLLFILSGCINNSNSSNMSNSSSFKGYDDISSTIVDPGSYDKVNQFVEEYIMPEVIAFYLATGYYGSCMYEESLHIHINSIIAEVFNGEEKDRPRLIDNIKKLLRIKYGLIVINEDPLDFASY